MKQWKYMANLLPLSFSLNFLDINFLAFIEHFVYIFIYYSFSFCQFYNVL